MALSAWLPVREVAGAAVVEVEVGAGAGAEDPGLNVRTAKERTVNAVIYIFYSIVETLQENPATPNICVATASIFGGSR